MSRARCVHDASLSVALSINVALIRHSDRSRSLARHQSLFLSRLLVLVLVVVPCPMTCTARERTFAPISRPSDICLPPNSNHRRLWLQFRVMGLVFIETKVRRYNYIFISPKRQHIIHIKTNHQNTAKKEIRIKVKSKTHKHISNEHKIGQDNVNVHYLAHTHTHTPVLRPFFQNYPGEPVPER